MSWLAAEVPKGSSAPGVGLKLRAEPSRGESAQGRKRAAPSLVSSEGKGKARSCPRWGQLAWDGYDAELWGFSQRREEKDAVW